MSNDKLLFVFIVIKSGTCFRFKGIFERPEIPVKRISIL